jgi:tetratricopeptide (TPR) repeat protein
MTAFKPKTKVIFCQVSLLLLIALLFMGSYAVRIRLENRDIRLKSMEVYMYIPSAEFLKPFTLGYNQLAADYFWVKTISYFGDHVVTDRQYPWLYHILDLVTTLDPHCTWPYFFGATILSVEANQIEQSNKILKKAMRFHPDNWKFPFYLGYNYWYHYDDPGTAARYLAIAAELPGAPGMLKTFPASLYSEAGQKQAALIFLQEMLQTAQDQLLIDQIQKRMSDIAQGKARKVKKLNLMR